MAETRAQQRLRHLRDDAVGDFTLKCHGRVWRVDTAILATENEWFDRIFALAADVSPVTTLPVSPSFSKVPRSGTPNEIDIDTWDADALDAVLVFLYTGEYDVQAVLGGDVTLNTSQALVHFFDFANHATKWKCETTHPEVSVLRFASKKTLTKVFLSMIQVHFIADGIGLRELTTLVAQKFFTLEQYLAKSELPAVLTSVFSHVDDDDRNLRMKIIKRCLANNNLVKADVEAENVLQEHEFTAWTLGLELLSDSNGVPSNAPVTKAADNQELRPPKSKDLKKLQAQLQQAKNEIDAKSQQITNLEASTAQSLGKQKACTKCAAHKPTIQSLEDKRNHLAQKVTTLEKQLQASKDEVRALHFRSTSNNPSVTTIRTQVHGMNQPKNKQAIKCDQLDAQIAQLKEDLEDVKYEWEQMPLDCKKCDRSLVGSK